jgi:hypothetical protein
MTAGVLTSRMVRTLPNDTTETPRGAAAAVRD